MIGETVGHYKIEEELGRGSAATVYRAVDTFLGRTVALKILHRELAADDEFMKRFRREAVAFARLFHPNIVCIYDVAGEGQMPYIVMEYCDGTTLSEILKKEHQLDTSAASRILPQIAMAMDYIHSHGLVHRDVKPGNIMIDMRGKVKITDMGIARAIDATGITVSGTILGTPEYMSPEQVRGEEVDSRSDIYSLGIVMFEMLSGRIPFKARNALVLAHKHDNGKIPQLHFINHSVSIHVERVVLKAMAKSPADRYKSCSELMKDWEEALNFRKTVPQEKSYECVMFAAEVFLILAFCAAGTAAFVKFGKTSVGIESGMLKETIPFAVTTNVKKNLPSCHYPTRPPGQAGGRNPEKEPYPLDCPVELDNDNIENPQEQHFSGYGACFAKDLDFGNVNANEENFVLCKWIAVSEKSNVTINNRPDKISVPKAKSCFTDFKGLVKNNVIHLPEAVLERDKVIAGKISIVNRSAGIVILHIGGATPGDILQVVRKGHFVTYLKIIRVYDFNTAFCRVVDNDDIWRLRNGDYAIGKVR